MISTTPVWPALVGAYLVAVALFLAALGLLEGRRIRLAGLLERMRAGAADRGGRWGAGGRRVVLAGTPGLVVLCLAAGFVGGAGLGGFVPGVLGAVGAVGAFVVARHNAHHQRARRMRAGLRAFVRDLCVLAAGGEAPARVFAEAYARAPGGMQRALQPAAVAAQAGEPLDRALLMLPGDGPLAAAEELHGLVQLAWLHRETGASLAALLADLVERSDEARSFRGELAAKTTEARWTARILAAVPLLLVAYLLVFDAWALAPLGADPAGRLAVVVAGGLWLCGVALTWRMQRPPRDIRGEV